MLYLELFFTLCAPNGKEGFDDRIRIDVPGMETAVLGQSNLTKSVAVLEAASTPAWANGPGLQRKRDATAFPPRAAARCSPAGSVAQAGEDAFY